MKSMLQNVQLYFLLIFLISISNFALSNDEILNLQQDYAFSSASALSNSAGARISLQRNYAIIFGNEIKSILCGSSPELVDEFVRQLLQDNKFPIIQYPVNYTPEQSLVLTIKTDDLVEESLRGKQIIYDYSKETAKWQFNPQSTLISSVRLPTVGMAIITEYCQNPLELQFKEDTLPDKEWCCNLWLKHVNPPFNGNKLPNYCSNNETIVKVENTIYAKDLNRCSSVYNQETGQLNIPKVVVKDTEEFYQVTLCNKSEQVFSLCNILPIDDIKLPFSDAIYDPDTEIATLPDVKVGIDHYTYELSLNEQMELKLLNRNKREDNNSLTRLVAKTKIRLQFFYTAFAWQNLKNLVEIEANSSLDFLKSDSFKSRIEKFANRMLGDNDPFIENIEYFITDRIEIILDPHNGISGQNITNNSLIDDKFHYQFIPNGDNNTHVWKFNMPDLNPDIDIGAVSEIKGITTSPEQLLREIAMFIIEEYCQGPTNDIGFPDMWTDTEWCQEWRNIVM